MIAVSFPLVHVLMEIICKFEMLKLLIYFLSQICSHGLMVMERMKFE